jgi:integrase
MRSSKKHAPYSLYKKLTKSGVVWYVRFWDAETQGYNIVRSTGILVEGKRERWREADDAAKAIFERLQQEKAKNTISLPTKEETIPLQATPLQPEASQLPVFENPPNEADTPFIQYLLDFWKADSEYVKYKRDVKKKPLSAYYVKLNHDDVAIHIASFPNFQNIKLRELTKKLLKEWLIWMSTKKIVHKRKDGTESVCGFLSGRRINSVLQGMRVAVRWAVDNETLPTDPFKRLDEATEESKEKGILTSVELFSLIGLPVKDPYSRLAVLLAARCGMRRGEIRGLQWGDIKNGIITIQHNYTNSDGLKAPKIKGGIIVKNSCPVPLPSDVEAVLEIVRRFSEKTGENDYVMQSWKRPGSVISAEYFRCALARELRSIGIDEETQKARNITFHGLRHTFVSLGRLFGLNDFEIQTLARHKSRDMMERYSHGQQAIDFITMKKRLEAGVQLIASDENTETPLLKAVGGSE